MPHDKPFDDPKRVVLSRIYTRGGDEGQTSLVGGQRVAKDTLRIEAYGTVDELNAFVGLARTLVEETARRHRELGAFATTLRRIQHELFNLGSILATLPADVHPKQPQITRAEIDRLEQEIDLANQSLPVLRSFVLPAAAVSTPIFTYAAPSAAGPNAWSSTSPVRAPLQRTLSPLKPSGI